MAYEMRLFLAGRTVLEVELQDGEHQTKRGRRAKTVNYSEKQQAELKEQDMTESERTANFRSEDCRLS